jgi:lipopolysaccharide biosynthesis regulator YciM
MANRQLKTTTANDIQIGGDHYQSTIEHWDYVLANDIPYMEAQIIRYVTRWRKKGGLDDLAKAAHFLMKLIEHNGGDIKEYLHITK